MSSDHSMDRLDFRSIECHITFFGQRTEKSLVGTADACWIAELNCKQFKEIAMVNFNQKNPNPEQTLRVDCASVLHASQVIQSNWTPDERLERGVLARKQTLKLLELVFGTTSIGCNP